MKSRHITQAAAATAFLITAALLAGAEFHLGQSAGLTVHEWGTFTSVAGEDGNSINWNVLGGNDDLPRFVNDNYHCIKRLLTGSVRMETPVLYFYTARPTEARVHVSFPQGTITEWYPQADQSSGIEWKNLKIEPGTTPVYPVEKSPSRYYEARATDAAPVTAGSQHEKFLFYRGVGSFPIPLSARVTADGSVAVTNRTAGPIPTVILFENRGGRIGFRTTAVADTISIDRPSLDAQFPQLRSHLEAALIAEGLFPKEAAAMIETWRDSWFEEGARLIYIVPSRTVDEVLPLEIAPAPAQIARVFVGRIELITPATLSAVEQGVAVNDHAVAAQYGRFLEPILNRLVLANRVDTQFALRFRAGVPYQGRNCQ